MIARGEQNRRAIHQLIRISGLAFFVLDDLNARAMIGAKPEVIGLVVAGLVRQAVGVVLVRREARPQNPERRP